MPGRFTVAVDAMGGDHAPGPEVAGAVAAAASNAFDVCLVGDQAALEREIDAEVERAELDRPENLRIAPASEVVGMDEQPTAAYRKKRDSSLRVAMNLVAAGEADAVVSAGNSGAILIHANMVLKRLRGVERPGIVAMWPTPEGTPVLLCDAGANVEVRPTMLAQFGVLAACFESVLIGTPRPRVGVLSNGTEASKGNDLTRAAGDLLAAAARHPDAGFEYVGYVEGNTLLRGGVDVVTTDGFTGNVVLKISEGVAEAILRMVRDTLESSLRAKVGAALVRPALHELRQSIHPSEFGGAPLLGVRELVMICHGSADALAIENAISNAAHYLERGLVEQLAKAIGRHRQLLAPATPA